MTYIDAHAAYLADWQKRQAEAFWAKLGESQAPLTPGKK